MKSFHITVYPAKRHSNEDFQILQINSKQALSKTVNSEIQVCKID